MLTALESWYNPRKATLIFSYIRRLGSFFGVQNFESHYFWGFSSWGIKILWRFFFLGGGGVITKLDYI